MAKKVLVAGAGKSGIGSIGLLMKAGVPARLYDGNAKLEAAAVRAKFDLPEDLPMVFGELTDEVIADTEYCVISPGIPADAPFATALREAGVSVLSEVELAYRYAHGKLAAITGTNGKTTTTALVGEMLGNYCDSAYTVGNIGIPYTEKALSMTDESMTVVEVSSFQLETIDTFHPEVSAILNITPDHLNRHYTMENYARVKELVIRNQTMDDTCVLNYDDPMLREFGESAKEQVKVVWFSSSEELSDGYFLRDGKIMYAENGEAKALIGVEELNIIGRHNYENAMAAIAIGVGMGLPMDGILDTCRSFKAVAHRIEFTAKKNGVSYYNDSKGTNPDAAIQAIRAMSAPTVLIGGGYDKGSTYEEWIEAFDGKVKLLLLMGQTREKIAETCEKLGMTDYRFVESMEEAVQVAYETACPGEMVLLSPACASWGMFDNYEQRGDIFKELVRKLPD